MSTVFGIAVAVSVIHYADNFFNYDAYPLVQNAPNPSAALVGVGWFLFTAVGAGGLWLWFSGRYTGAALALAAYSGSGLVGVGHYLAPGAFQMVWWRQAHIVADILCGLAVLGLATWVLLRPGRPTSISAR